MEFYCKHKDSFCFLCGHFVASRNIKKRSENFVIYIRTYYGEEMEWIDEPYIPTIGCTACYSSMKRCFENNQHKPKYKVPMKWNNPGDHDDGTCYFCTNTKHHLSTKKGRKIEYTPTPYVELPELHTSSSPPLNVIYEQPNEPGDFDMDTGVNVEPNRGVDFDDITDAGPSTSTTSYAPSGRENIGIKLISQARLNNMCRILDLSQDKSRDLARMLKQDNLLAPGVTVRSQTKRQAAFIPYFATILNLTYCLNIAGLMKELKIPYDPSDWRLFIDASKSGLKAVLLHNDGAFMPVPVAYSRILKESYDSMKLIFDKIKYNEHKWDVSGDLKVVALILGLQLGRTKNSCFICTWISTAKIKHYHATWEKRSDYKIGMMNIVRNSLCPREKILLPTLHIKLGLISSFIRKLDKNSEAFQYLGVLFPRLSLAKRSQGKCFYIIFVCFNGKYYLLNSGFNFLKVFLMDQTSVNL